MRKLEIITDRISYLMKEKLPEYIEKINKEENDGILLKPFTNTELKQENLKIPYYTFAFEEASQSRKDRIIGTIEYKFVIELFLDKSSKNHVQEFCRYFAAICTMLDEDEFDYWQYHLMTAVGTKKLILRLKLEQ